MTAEHGDEADIARRRAENARQASQRAVAHHAEARQRLGSVWYRSRRIQRMQTILNHARAGSLPADWRDQLTQPDYVAATAHIPGYQLYSDGDALLITELQTMPIAAWEPGARAEWRSALRAWLAAAEKTVDDYTAMAHSTQESLARPETADTTRQHIRQSAEFTALRERDMYGASYRAGLAAGGDPIDWRAWLRQRVQGWPDLPVRATVLQHLDDPDYGSEFEFLPPYWLNHT